jgi:hypothetical protein
VHSCLCICCLIIHACALSVILHVEAYESSSTRLHLHEQLASCIKTGV